MSFKNLTSLKHSCCMTLLETTVLTAVTCYDVHLAIAVVSTGICKLFLYSAFEETLAAFARKDTIVISSSFITANKTQWTNRRVRRSNRAVWLSIEITFRFAWVEVEFARELTSLEFFVAIRPVHFDVQWVNRHVIVYKDIRIFTAVRCRSVISQCSWDCSVGFHFTNFARLDFEYLEEEKISHLVRTAAHKQTQYAISYMRFGLYGQQFWNESRALSKNYATWLVERFPA